MTTTSPSQQMKQAFHKKIWMHELELASTTLRNYASQALLSSTSVHFPDRELWNYLLRASVALNPYANERELNVTLAPAGVEYSPLARLEYAQNQLHKATHALNQALDAKTNDGTDMSALEIIQDNIVSPEFTILEIVNQALGLLTNSQDLAGLAGTQQHKQAL